MVAVACAPSDILRAKGALATCVAGLHEQDRARRQFATPAFGARVSTDGQTLDAQVAQLKAAGAEKVFQEKVSGARIDRPQLARLLRALEPVTASSSPALIGWHAQLVTC